MDRRRFIATTAGAAAATVLNYSSTADVLGANDKLVVAAMGMGGRGTTLASEIEGLNGVEVKAVYDVDRIRAEAAAAEVGKVNGRSISHGQDFRNALDDKEIDAIVIATCNHWHTPAALMAAAAGKHVYVEKPCSQTPREGEMLVEAARRHDRRIQHGTQRRSMPALIEGIARVKEGAIGRVYYAKCYYRSDRPSLGHGNLVAAPANLDYDLWQGPAPRRPYKDNLLHYNWHWFWHYGNGELGNNGVHRIDIARAVLEVDYPIHVTSSGGRYRFPDDDQETPDTQDAVFTFEDGKSIAWEGLSCHRRFPDENRTELILYGTEGGASFHKGSYQFYDPMGKQIREGKGTSGNTPHLQNFVDSIRSGNGLNAEIEDGHKSALLCHLGNIAYRTRRALKCDPADGKIVGDTEAMNYWNREYERGWQPTV